MFGEVGVGTVEVRKDYMTFMGMLLNNHMLHIDLIAQICNLLALASASLN